MTTETSAAVCPGLFHVLIDGRRMPTEGEAWAELERRAGVYYKARWPDGYGAVLEVDSPRPIYVTPQESSRACKDNRHTRCFGLRRLVLGQYRSERNRYSKNVSCDCSCHNAPPPD